MNISAIILADNKEPLKNSKKAKVMCDVLFKPMIDWVIKAAKDAGTDNICVVAGKNLPCIESHINDSEIKVFASLQQATESVNKDIIIMLNGDKPFIDTKTIKSALEIHINNGNDKTVISEESIGYCINSGSIGKSGLKTGVYASLNKNIGLTANTGAELNRLNEIMRQLLLENLMNNGVDIPCTDGIIIGPDCSIGCDTKILPNTIICGNVTIGEDCIIGPNSYIENAEIGNGVKFNNGQIRNAKIMNNADIGPFVQVRPDAVIGDNVHLGNFVEVKNSVIDTGTKVSHLTYVGDSDVGKDVNFGCGVVTVNFTGKTKHRTIIKDGAFIGCNTNLVAPVTVGENSYTAAGSTITQDVPDNTLAIARERQINKEGWVKEKQPYRKKV
ncbi:MAG: bifunctional UDP-N-acetylglucosamine diphosphorylase/glucosamine-1-phosphate N-acetyltransferase GlmU [Clostridia bacterium]|nr:bifunctional UDP-N-acetylglucosamine diphosphorylase/glucosamine-1-phosphate N-acetyltransferase GlmU [Clostridia bacterium]